ncbi:MAG: sigma 54-interacting transcriptional regulator, partial [Planctomycetaceae bacterium]
SGQVDRRRPNLLKLSARATQVANRLREQLDQGAAASADELALYDGLVTYLLFYDLYPCWGPGGEGLGDVDGATDARAWRIFEDRFQHWHRRAGRAFPPLPERVRLFELFHQVYRAFFQIFNCVVGQSQPAAALRARIWQSIFTHDFQRYRRGLGTVLDQVTTLVTGPSGSGKELVARAIGLSRPIPFDSTRRRFSARPEELYRAVNISALARGVVEAELFGHARGAFTGATAARVGWLETCGPHGALLLDEIGELDPTAQVKLLRVLQNRQFQRLGETRDRVFQGKIIAATNRDLRREIAQGRFREDLYYRLCADVVETPSLASQLRDNPAVLEQLAEHLARRLVPGEAQLLAGEVVAFVRREIPRDYSWPGNIRELEQCVRNVLICGRYVPQPAAEHSPPGTWPPEIEGVARQFARLELTADELLRKYCQHAYRQTGSFERSARLLQLDRRTVRAKVDRPGNDPTP